MQQNKMECIWICEQAQIEKVCPDNYEAAAFIHRQWQPGHFDESFRNLFDVCASTFVLKSKSSNLN